MRVYSRIWKTGLVLIVATMLLAGCNRGSIRERLSASQPDVVTIDMQSTPAQTAMPSPNSGTQANPAGSTTSNNLPTATPKTASQNAASADESDAEIDQLMDELETALSELESATTKADQDALLDATLAALGK